MNKRIMIKTKEGNVLFKGHIFDLPIKNDYIIKRSIEIFDDDDPCIIHKSFVIKKIVDELLSHTLLIEKKTIQLTDYKDYFHFLDLNTLNCDLTLGDE